MLLESGPIHMELKFRNVSEFVVASELLRFGLHLDFLMFGPIVI